MKEGRGVYHFPRGGVYEGEWRRGKMEGVGVRTFASGKVQASGVLSLLVAVAQCTRGCCSLFTSGTVQAAL